MNTADMNILICLLRCISLDVQVVVKLLYFCFFLFFFLDREILFSDVTELVNAHSG